MAKTDTVEVLLKDAADLAETLAPPSSLVGKMVIVLAKQVEQLTGKTLAPLAADILNPATPKSEERKTLAAVEPSVSEKEQELAERLAKLETKLAEKEQ